MFTFKFRKWHMPIIVIGSILMLIGCEVDQQTKNDEELAVSQETTEKSVEETTPDEVEEEQPDEQKEEIEVEPPKEQEPTKEQPAEVVIDVKNPTYVQGVLVVNKKYGLPKTFAPGESKEARLAFDKMSAAASLEGFELVAFSTYRSYEKQEQLYTKYVQRDGQAAADRYSAKPGFSEHQTGLAFDVGERNMEKHWASPTFGKTPAGKWLASSASQYGFIIRYPENKEAITGYMHESWHLRYVGAELASKIQQSGLTLEEYLGIN